MLIHAAIFKILGLGPKSFCASCTSRFCWTLYLCHNQEHKATKSMLNRAFKSAELAINDLSKTNANHSTLQK